MLTLVIGHPATVFSGMRRFSFFLIAVVLTALACSDAGDSSVSAASDAGIDWEACGQNECGTLSVPLDYAKPDGATIELSLVRYKARDPDRRIGVLLANPGGPGASANDFMRIWRSIVSSELRDRFDFVSFDPRGVGDSSPVVCHDNLQDLVAADPDPDTEAEWQEAKAESKEFADNCAKKYGAVLPHLGTKNVARDMDAIRVALGEEKLNYVGYSYGTSLGAVYADMFPGRIRAMVLDGGTNLSLDFAEVNLTQMIGFERAFQAYLDNCKEKSCALAKNGDPRTAVEAIIARAELKPIPSKDADRPAGPGEVQLGIISAMYSTFSWNSLTQALVAAQGGDGSGLVDLTDEYLQRDGSGDYPNLIEANAAVNYVDQVCPKDPDAYRNLGDEFAKQAPTFGRSAATAGLTCAYWQAAPDAVRAPEAKGAPPILVIATTNDPATPYEWGKALSEQLDSGVLVTHRGEGHTIYAQGNKCIDSLVNAYLLALAVPAAGTTCGTGALPPGQSATATPSSPPTEGAGTPAAASPTASPRESPRPPATGDARDDGSLTVGLWAAGAVLAALLAGALTVLVIRRT
ncbi:MAG: alpha/beta fold hydrolase [Dehalococcoidia bacterium]|nr:alpha/beta fold hydrolase [Dehalococcoidia bacterium]